MALHSSIGVAEEVLKNQDVVKMVSAGLGEEVVVAKIREAPRVDFQLGIDDLVALRKAGVSDRIVSAMLDRSKSVPQRPDRTAAAPGSARESVSLKTADGLFPLRMVNGEISNAGYNIFMNYPGLRSTVRTHDKHPALLVTCPAAPEVGHYFIAKFDPDTRHTVRSLKLGQAIRWKGTPGGRFAPDADWILPFDIQDENQGTWRFTLKVDLKPGEYGLYINLPDASNPLAALDNTCFRGGGAFDFGVD